ncbi:MAG: riboflavin synthase [Thiotrichales bacterium]
MFTGIIQAVGAIRAKENRGGDLRLTLYTAALDMHDVALGDSIAVNGVCLTAIEYGADHFAADVSNETLACTTLGALPVGAPVNLEKALTPTTRLGGHLVSGHVDGLGEIIERRPDARSERFVIRAPHELSRYIAAKGSICVDGISLTVNHVEGDLFGLNIVPHTLSATQLGRAQPGQRVNLEVDVIARYLERLLQGAQEVPETTAGGVTESLLARVGFAPPTR